MQKCASSCPDVEFREHEMQSSGQTWSFDAEAGLGIRFAHSRPGLQ